MLVKQEFEKQSMLSPDDKQLVRHDPEIPGLTLLLDSEVVWEVRNKLQWHNADQISIDYLRYKPSTNCIALFRGQFGDRTEYAYAIAFGRSTRDKLTKICHRFAADAVILSESLGVIAFRFPADRRLGSLPEFSSVRADSLLQKLLQNGRNTSQTLKTLKYKPERRYVGKIEHDGVPLAVVKLYDDLSYVQARRAAKSIAGDGNPGTLRSLGHSDRHSAIAFAWQDGIVLSNQLSAMQFQQAGTALANFHKQSLKKLPRQGVGTFISRLKSIQAYLTSLLPDVVQEIAAVVQRIEKQLLAVDLRVTNIHGDLHVDQFIVTPDSISLIDFDRACLSSPEWDIVNLECDLCWRESQGQLGSEVTSELLDAFIEGYQSEGTTYDRKTGGILAALRTLETATIPFRQRNPHWRNAAYKTIQRAGTYLGSTQRTRTLDKPLVNRPLVLNTNKPRTECPNGRCEDPHLPSLRDALDFIQAHERLWNLPSMDGEHKGLDLQEVRLVRHKLGRRSLIEYSGESRSTGRPLTVLGKIDSKPRYRERFDNQCLLWNAGFQSNSTDGVSVARPWGLIPEWSMWCQEKVAGQGGRAAILGPDRAEVARRVSIALAKLHRADIPLTRTHDLQDEKLLLTDRLQRAANLFPHFSERIHSLLESCIALTHQLPDGTVTSIHRDFYPDQLLVSAGRITLVDFDLLCRGDACLDIGNFIGHLREMSIRSSSNARYFEETQQVFRGNSTSHLSASEMLRVHAYSAFTLARHIFISAEYPERINFVEPMIECSEREMEHVLKEFSTKAL